MKWKYIKALENDNFIDEFETEYKCKLPKDFRQWIKANNAGRPELSVFDSDITVERTIKKLLSFDSGDIENIWEENTKLQETNKTLIAFANDSFGNYICFDSKNNIVFFEHETEKIEKIALDFSEFCRKLK